MAAFCFNKSPLSCPFPLGFDPTKKAHSTSLNP
jgi:hypothetical protein